MTDYDLLQQQILPALKEGARMAGKLDTAGHPDHAKVIRQRCGYLTNQSQAIYTRALSAEERKMVATHLKKLHILIAEATKLLKASPPTP